MQAAAKDFLSKQLEPKALESLFQKACKIKPPQDDKLSERKTLVEAYKPYDLLDQSEMTKDILVEALVARIKDSTQDSTENSMDDN